MAPKLPLPADADLPEEVRTALASLPPLNVFRMVAAVPESFRPFLQLGGSLLAGAEIDPRTREIAILRVAHVTGAAYEWAQHVQLGRAVGVTEAEIEALASDDPTASLDRDAGLACRAAEEISRDVRLSDEGLEQLIERWGNHGAAELILCVSYYNMVSRFLESTRVEIEDAELLGGYAPADVVDRGRSASS